MTLEKPPVQGNKILLLINLGRMFSRGVGSRITGIPEGGVCVMVVVVVMVTWQSLKEETVAN